MEVKMSHRGSVAPQGLEFYPFDPEPVKFYFPIQSNDMFCPYGGAVSPWKSTDQQVFRGQY